jgi:hypothetical protein
MDKEIKKKKLEGRKSYHEFILEFHKETINIIGRKGIRNERDSKTLTYAVRSAGKVLELIEQDKQELRELKL